MQLVADANVLLSAVIGGRAKLVLGHPDVEAVSAPVFALDEVHKYLPVLADITQCCMNVTEVHRRSSSSLCFVRRE